MLLKQRAEQANKEREEAVDKAKQATAELQSAKTAAIKSMFRFLKHSGSHLL